MDDLKEIWRGSLEKRLSQDHWMSRLFSTKDAEGTAQVSWSTKKHITQVCSKDASDVVGWQAVQLQRYCLSSKPTPPYSALGCWARLCWPYFRFASCSLLGSACRGCQRETGEWENLPPIPVNGRLTPLPASSWWIHFWFLRQFGRYKLLERPHYVVTQLLYFLYLSIFSAQIQTVLPSTDVQKQPRNIPLQLTLKTCKCQSLWHCFSPLSLKR